MTFSFNSVRHLFTRVKQKDVGISHARANRSWLITLVGVCFIVIVGAVAAGYEFMHIEGVDAVLIVDPVETTRYHDAEIKDALTKYDALKEEFASFMASKPVAPSSIPKIATTSSSVAPTTGVSVE